MRFGSRKGTHELVKGIEGWHVARREPMPRRKNELGTSFGRNINGNVFRSHTPV